MIHQFWSVHFQFQSANALVYVQFVFKLNYHAENNRCYCLFNGGECRSLSIRY